jgi:hypothetical protein
MPEAKQNLKAVMQTPESGIDPGEKVTATLHKCEGACGNLHFQNCFPAVEEQLWKKNSPAPRPSQPPERLAISPG